MAKRRNDVTDTEREAMKQSEAALEVGDSQNVDEEQVDASLTEQGADADPSLPAEAAMMHTDTEAAAEASGDATKPGKRAKPATPRKPAKRRSVKYQAARAKLTETGAVSLERAAELVKATSYSTFDGTVELHARLTFKKKDAAESVRGLIQLPHGAPRQVNAVVLTEAVIDEIAASKRAPADLYLAPPALMPKVATIARILGPQGKMPNPKTGTVTDNPAATIAEIQSGRVEYRADSFGIVHVGVAKVSWEPARIAGNAQAVLTTLGTNRLRSVTLTSTMGPGIAIDLSTVTA